MVPSIIQGLKDSTKKSGFPAHHLVTGVTCSHPRYPLDIGWYNFLVLNVTNGGMGWLRWQLWIRSFPHSQCLAPVRLGYPEFVEKPIFWDCLSVFRWTASSEYHWNILAWLLVSCFNIILLGMKKSESSRLVVPNVPNTDQFHQN